MIMTMMMMKGSQVVKLRSEKLAECLTCPICENLFNDATTISECLHTFCRKCIYEKISDQELDCCPVCNIDLGCAPIEKLRADHNLQDLRAKLFPSKTKKDNKAHDTVSSAPLPAKQKERSLSSLAVTAPRASVQPRMSGRRKYPARKSLIPRESALPFKEPAIKVEGYLEKISSPETKNNITANVRLVEEKSTNEFSKQRVSSNSLEDNVKLWEKKVATKTKPNKAVVLDALNSQVNDPKVKVKKQGKRSRVRGYEKDSTPAPSDSVKRRKTQGPRQRRATVSQGLGIPVQSTDGASKEFARRFSPIWFSLIASNDQEGGAPLPQISSCYLRVKDGSLPVSLVKKYLVKKLDLASESEVEISMQGQPVIATLQLHNLVDLWRRTAPSSELIQTSVGSSGKDFVMVLSYGLKVQSSHKHV